MTFVLWLDSREGGLMARLRIIKESGLAVAMVLVCEPAFGFKVVGARDFGQMHQVVGIKKSAKSNGWHGHVDFMEGVWGL